MRINAAFQGKQLSMEEEPCEVRKVIKGGAKDTEHEVDAISGASITSGAVGTTVRTWVKYYLPYLNKLAAESAAAQEPVAEEIVEPTTEEE